VAFFVIEDSFKRQIASFHVILVVYFERERGGDIMTTKKDSVIVILATFCLTLTLFGIMPTRSAGTYDPWLDTNEDGRIDGKDIGAAAKAFGTLGDPTKIVTIGKHETYEWAGWLELVNGSMYMMINETRGYERVTFAMRIAYGQMCYVSIGWWVYNETSGNSGFIPDVDNFFLNGTDLWPEGAEFVKTYQVQGTHIVIQMAPPFQSNVTICAWIYMTT